MSSDEHPPTASPLSPSHPHVTASDHTSLLIVVGWFSVVIIVIILLTRLGTRHAKSRTVGFDDAAIILSTVLAICQMTSVSIGVKNGLGRLTGKETEWQLIVQQKTVYASMILFILGQFFAKLSIIGFVMALTPDRTHSLFSWCLCAITCVWMLTSVFGFAFQCDLPQPWKFIGNKCTDRLSFYTFVEVFNVVLDSALALFPSLIIFGLQLEKKRKMITIAFFMSRLFVVAASIAQLVTIYSRTEDPFLSWTFALLITIIQTLGIVTACGPYLRPFLDSINSGMIGNDDIRRRQGGTAMENYGSKDSKGSQQSKMSNKSSWSLFARGKSGENDGSKAHEESELGVVDKQQITSQGQTSHSAQISTVPIGEGEEWEVGSQSSRTRIIRQTTTYRVSSDTSE